ncbi:hypothetical protein SUGI_0699850 [Cryptomeria japonica]|nr:hypothetical protein SUGI_0699850 [Cryptomeria japonica]
MDCSTKFDIRQGTWLKLLYQNSRESDCILGAFSQNTHNPVFQNKDIQNSTFFNIQVDILKLENQIPLFALITLLELEVSEHAKSELGALLQPDELESRTRKDVIAELAALLSTTTVFRGFPFSPLLSSDEVKLKLKNKRREQRPCHLLDLYRIVIKHIISDREYEWYTKVAPPFRNIDLRSTLSAQLLDSAGIKFQPGKIGFRKRMFGKSTLSLPQIIVDDTTETFLRNLMAYEECQRCSLNPEETLISHYVRLLDCLIDSEKDVFVLRNSGVIRSLGGNDDHIAHMFINLAAGTTFSPINEFENVMEEARKHYSNHWKVLMTEFQRAYCSKPWHAVSLVAATTLLVMTFIQTMY